jgi:hypothetical protein
MSDSGSSPFRVPELTAARPDARRIPYPRLTELDRLQGRSQFDLMKELAEPSPPPA